MRSCTAILLAAIGLAGCQRHEAAEFDRQVQFEPAPLYCYSSLARVTCYAQPLAPSQTDRMVGFYGPPPPPGVMAPAAAPLAMPQGDRPAPVPEPQPRTPVDAQPLPRVAPLGKPAPAPSS